MFRSAYETTPCRDYTLTTIITAIKKQRLIHPEGFDNVTAPVINQPINGCIFITPKAPDVPSFAHPMVVDDDNKMYAVYTDVRNFTRITREQIVVVSSRLDYDLAVIRTWLQRIWLAYSPMDLLGLGAYPVTVYSRWVTECITKRLALPPEAQMRVSVILAYFYVCMFYSLDHTALVYNDKTDGNWPKFEPKEMLKVAALVARATSVNAETVIQIIEPLPVCSSVNELSKVLIEHGGSMRFQDFSASLLYGIISGSWFGQNHRELVAVAIEHPVTFMAILAKAVNERGYHNTIIGKVAKLADKGDLAKTYVHNLLNLPVD